MNIDRVNNIFFVGIGGIGMSALARYFKTQGKNVWGYDRTSTELTVQLVCEGIPIHYEDEVGHIPGEVINDIDNTLVIYTPAIPKGHNQFNFFLLNGYTIKKRSEVLGEITGNKNAIAVSGTHGKTTISTMIAFLLDNSPIGCNAFLGGISKNYKSNLLLSNTSEFVVVEADEFDRSFLKLTPGIAIITAIDTDHLDIYNDPKEIKKAFIEFMNKIKPGGTLIIKKELHLQPNRNDIKIYQYSLDQETDFYAKKIQKEGNFYIADVETPFGLIPGVKVGMPGLVNMENAIAAIAAAKLSGVEDKIIIDELPNFLGVARRFDYQVKEDNLVYIDDYAHHPREIEKFVLSVKNMYPGKSITGIFQPHLYTRTRDLADEFAQALDLLDRTIILDIYPAREEPIEGVTSHLIYQKMNNPNKIKCTSKGLIELVENEEIEVLLTMGAGDIDKLVGPVKKVLLEKMKGAKI